MAGIIIGVTDHQVADCLSFDGECFARVLNRMAARYPDIGSFYAEFDAAIDEEGAALLRALVGRLPREGAR